MWPLNNFVYCKIANENGDGEPSLFKQAFEEDNEKTCVECFK